MTGIGWFQILLYTAVILAITKPLGAYMHRVYEGDRQPLPRVLGRFERLLYRLSGVDPKKEQTWKQYALALLAFSVVGLLVTYAVQRLQGALPLNPQRLPAVGPELSFNTAVSFTSNTNWQSYGGETTMSYLTQMTQLTWHNFVSAGAGIGVALAIARGLTRQVGPDGAKTLGNFWVDLIRSVVYVLLPLSIVVALVLVAGGVIQSFSPYLSVTTLDGGQQTLAMGPAASQIAIKQLGTNGGGFFNVNSAHPFENSTPIINFLECLAILAIPAALTYTYGRMARDQKQGWAIFAAMMFLFLAGNVASYAAEADGNRIVADQGVSQPLGNMEGKEVRHGVASSVLWAVATTDASNGSVNSMHDSYTPIGGLVPEYLGKKIEAREMKIAMLYILIFPLLLLGFAAWAAVSPSGVSSLNNGGPHGLSEILYAFSSSATGNNGAAFAGLNANTPFWNVAMGLAMLGGRFLMIIPVLAIAGSMVGKKTVAPGPGTFPTNGALFAGLLVGVILIVGALTFLPALSLGPILEHYSAAQGQVF
jgi:K+-transporting ATPase ATPase A chain